jgi:hypothetical protein
MKIDQNIVWNEIWPVVERFIEFTLGENEVDAGTAAAGQHRRRLSRPL